jgi:outer membrane biosynthesis protein TonB
MSVRATLPIACCLLFNALLSAQQSKSNQATPNIVCTIPRGKIVHMVQPIYPPRARAEHVEGDVVLQLRLARDGTVEKIKTPRGDPTLAESAEQAVA